MPRCAALKTGGKPVTNPTISAATLKQNQASNPAHSVWVSANAGTGKTHVLTQRIVRLLLADDTLMPHEILAMTYTNAAANEMRTRVRKMLADLAVMPEEELQKTLKQMDIPPHAAGRARALFNILNESAEDLNIATIHGFCQRFLRRFPLEANTPPNFSVAEEQETKDLLQEAFEKAIQQMAAGTNWYYSFFTSNLGDTTLKKSLDGFVNNAGDYTYLFLEQGGLNNVLNTIAKQLGVSPHSVPNNLPPVEQSMWPDKTVLDALKNLIPLLAGTGKRAEEHVLHPFSLALQTQNPALYRAAFFNKSGELKKLAWALGSQSVQSTAPELLDLLLQEQSRIEGIEETRRNLKTFLMTSAYLNMGATMLEIYAALKNERVVLDYDDLIIKTKTLLADATQNAWVIYRMDSQIKHIMLDEGQDTDRHQWHIIKALVQEFYATTTPHPRTLFAVGDIKQSIYRFRGAQPSVFKKIFPYINQFSETHSSSNVSMNVSFRSAPVILQFVDDIFKQNTQKLGEDSVAHKAAFPARGGRVTVWPLIEKEAPQTTAEDGWQLPPENPKNVPEATSPYRTLAGHVAQEVFRLISSNLTLDCRNGKKIEPEDIMVLLHKRAAAAEIIAAFNKVGIPHTGFDRLKFADDPMITDIVNTLHFLAHKDDYSLALSLRSTLFGWADEDLMALRQQNTQAPLWHLLQKHGGPAAEILSTLLKHVDYDSVYTLTLRLLETTQARGKFASQYGQSASSILNDTLDAFLNTLQKAPNLPTFLHLFNKEAPEVKRALENAKGAVRIMTAHGAKGLQAPIVFLPDTTNPYVSTQKSQVVWQEDAQDVKQFCLFNMNKAHASQLQNKLSQAEAEKAEKDALRLLYVAATRAEEILYIGGAEKTTKDCWYNHIQTVLKTNKMWQEEGVTISTPTSCPPLQTQPEENTPTPLPAWAQNPAPTMANVAAQSVTGLRQQQLKLQGSQTSFGQLVHKALEVLPNTHPSADPKMAQPVAIAQKVYQTFPQLFGPNTAPEVPLAAIINGQPLHGVVDRLVVKENEVWVIDYKSEKNIPPEMPQAYAEQMAYYRQIAQQIFPQHVIKLGVLWVRATPAPTLQWVG